MLWRDNNALVDLLRTTPQGFCDGANREQILSATRRVVHLCSGPLRHDTGAFYGPNEAKITVFRKVLRARCVLAAQKLYPLMKEDEQSAIFGSLVYATHRETLCLFLALAQALHTSEKELRLLCEHTAA